MTKPEDDPSSPIQPRFYIYQGYFDHDIRIGFVDQYDTEYVLGEIPELNRNWLHRVKSRLGRNFPGDRHRRLYSSKKIISSADEHLPPPYFGVDIPTKAIDASVCSVFLQLNSEKYELGNLTPPQVKCLQMVNNLLWIRYQMNVLSANLPAQIQPKKENSLILENRR